MHIPENYLSPETCAVMAAAMVPVWYKAVKKVKETVPKEKMPLLGIFAAFSFLSMMFNIPLPGGTTGHAVGGTLIALLLGPEAACISVTIALLLQALLFGDGGILAFGANCFNMAFVLPFVGHAVYHAVNKAIKAPSGKYIAAGLGAYVGINAAVAILIIFAGLDMIKKMKKTLLPVTLMILTLGLSILFDVLDIPFSAIYYILIGGFIGILLSLYRYHVTKKNKAILLEGLLEEEN